MSEIERYKGEYTVLSYLVTCAERAREIMRRATVNESMFSSDENRAAFIALMAEPATDDTLLLGVAAKALPALSGDPAFTAAFLGLSANPGALEYETEQFVEAAIMRDHAQKMHQTFLQYGGRQAEFLLDVQRTGASERIRSNSSRSMPTPSRRKGPSPFQAVFSMRRNGKGSSSSLRSIRHSPISRKMKTVPFQTTTKATISTTKPLSATMW